MFHMSKVAFDPRQKTEFLSGPIKQVVLMAPSTKFEPIMAGSLTLAKQAVPAAKIEDILEMSELPEFKGGRYDVAGFVRAGPLKTGP